MTRRSLLALLAWVATARAQRGGRIRPPEGLACDPNQLTLYLGRVESYERAKDRVKLEIATDWNSRETVEVHAEPDKTIEALFLIDGKPFKAEDWARIEARSGELHRGMRAAAWVCEKGPQPVIDWRPSESTPEGSTARGRP